MYTTAKNVQIVIALLKAHGLKRFVLSPGGTNAPFVQAIQDDVFFQCYSIVDERSAAYFALGLYLETGEPIAICCTSAQATRNYLPGLTEAFYKHSPILAITFSKHPRFTYQDYMQAPDQTSLPKDSVKASYALPYVCNNEDRLYCERLTNEALMNLLYPISGPIQLNVPMLDSELSSYDTPNLPVVKVIQNVNQDNCVDLQIEKKKILVVVGENRGLCDSSLIKFAMSHNVAIYVNHLSNMSNEYTVQGNALLAVTDQAYFDMNLCPDVLITIGGQTGDYSLFNKLSKTNKKYEHWRFSIEGKVVDTYDHLTKVINITSDDFFSLMSKRQCCDNTYFGAWYSAVNSICLDVDVPLSNIYVAQQLHRIIPQNSLVNFSIHNSLRVWNYFPFKNYVRCFCNVAAFGIDGCMSTFIGQSVCTDSLCYLIIGDLSFFYDMNSIGIRHIKNNIRIILINNNGGMEFKLGENQENNSHTDQYVAASGHFKNSRGWALTNNFMYIPINNKEEFDTHKEVLIKESTQPILMEVFVNDVDENTAYISLRKANDKRSVLRKTASLIKNTLLK